MPRHLHSAHPVTRRPARGARRTGLALWLALVAGQVLCSNARAAEPQPTGPAAARNSKPNIVLIIVCTFRYDHLGAAGYPRRTTPFLDSLAEEGAFFENVVATSTWTKPTVSSILTGLTPNVHGMNDYYVPGKNRPGSSRPQRRRVLADGVVTLAECLRAQGYATGFWSNNVHASPFFKMTQGVRNAVFKPGLNTPGMLREFAKWLAGRRQDRPCFAVVVTRDAHTNYDPKYEYYLRFNRSAEPVAPTDYARHPDWLRKKIDALLKAKSPVPPELQRQWIDLYDAELAQLDDALSRVPDLLQAAGRQSNTIIAVIGDHGELFFEHGRIGHSGMPHEPVLHVPLILHGPGIPSGKRIKRLVRSIDLYPTLAALAGASVPHVVQGRSLLPILRGDESALPPMSALASFVRAKAVYHMVRAGDHKLVYDALNDTRQLYDLQRDPRELNNIIDAEPDLAERLNQLLSEWLRSEQALREHIDRGPERELSPEVLEQLRSLGYIR